MRVSLPGSVKDQRGFTLPELLIVIVIMGILATIAIPSWFGLMESRDIDSAANQVAADMRLAHTAAINRLGTAQIVFNAENRTSGTQVTCNGVQADYCLVRPNGSSTPGVKPRFLPDRAGISRVGTSIPVTSATLPTGVLGTGQIINIQFGANGSVNTTPVISSVDPRVRVGTTDNDPGYSLQFNTQTSRIKVV